MICNGNKLIGCMRVIGSGTGVQNVLENMKVSSTQNNLTQKKVVLIVRKNMTMILRWLKLVPLKKKKLTENKFLAM